VFCEHAKTAVLDLLRACFASETALRLREEGMKAAYLNSNEAGMSSKESENKEKLGWL
jgi:hypothetical protein